MAGQLAATFLIALIAALLAGGHGFFSALLGGCIGVAGVLAFALVAARRGVSAGQAVRIALRAEAAKIVAIVLLLWLAFSGYGQMQVLAFIAAFIVSILLSGLAFAVADE